jgi:potassium-dependent mechanosensitive channel
MVAGRQLLAACLFALVAGAPTAPAFAVAQESPTPEAARAAVGPDREVLEREVDEALAKLARESAAPLAAERRSVLASFLGAIEVAVLRASVAAQHAQLPQEPLPQRPADGWVGTPELDRWRDQRDALALQVGALAAAIQSLSEQNERDNAQMRSHRSEERLWAERARLARPETPEAADAAARESLAHWRARQAEFLWSEAVAARRSAEAALPALDARLAALDALVSWGSPRQRLDDADLERALTAVDALVSGAERRADALRSRAHGVGPDSLDAAAAVAAEKERIALLRGQRDVWVLRARAVRAMSAGEGRHEVLAVLDEAIRQLASRQRWAEGQLAYAQARAGDSAEARSRRALLEAAGRSRALLERTRADLRAAIGVAEPRGWMRRAADALGGMVRSLWEWELFAVTDRHVVDGREVVQEYGVTLGKSVGVLLLLLSGYALVAGLSRLLGGVLLPRMGVDRQPARTITRWVSGLLLLVVVLLALKLARIPLVAFAFLGGALAIGIGFGAQTLLKNVMSGALILLERRIRVGDVLTVGGASGTCTDIGLRSTTVAGFDGIEMIVPNAVLLESTVNNWTGATTLVRREVLLVVPCDGREQASADLVAECARAAEGVLADPPPKVLATRFISGGVELTLQFWVAIGRGPAGPDIESRLRFEISRRLFDENIAVLPPMRVTLVPWSGGPRDAPDPAGA